MGFYDSVYKKGQAISAERPAKGFYEQFFKDSGVGTSVTPPPPINLPSGGDILNAFITPIRQTFGGFVPAAEGLLSKISGGRLKPVLSGKGNNLLLSQDEEKRFQAHPEEFLGTAVATGATVSPLGALGKSSTLLSKAPLAVKAAEVGKGAVAQGGIGALYGASQPAETLEERIENAKSGAVFGAGAGAVLPFAGAAGLKLLRKVRRTPEELPTSPIKLEEGKTITGKPVEIPRVPAPIQALTTPEVPAPRVAVSAVPEPLRPLGGGETRTAGLAAGVEAKAVEAKLVDRLGELPEYQRVSMPEQARLSTELTVKNPELAVRVALGQERSPEGLLPEAVFTAVENKALKEGNVELITKLSKSPRILEETAMGQRIRALAERQPDGPVEALKQIYDLRKKAIESRLKEPVDRAVTRTKAEIQSKIKLPAKDEWQAFMEELQCR